MKSVPDDDLLKMLAADLDPAHVKQLDQMILWTQELQECMIMQYCSLCLLKAQRGFKTPRSNVSSSFGEGDNQTCR